MGRAFNGLSSRVGDFFRLCATGAVVYCIYVMVSTAVKFQ